MTDATELARLVVGWRRHLHAHPDLSGDEGATAAFVAARLTEHGIAHETGVGGHGVVARLHRPGSNRSVGLRADMDALPIAEETKVPHASTRAGVMHACGHDGHTAALIGAAIALDRDPDWSGTIHLIFQPAEENGLGAKAMIADGLFDRYPTERLFASHNWPGVPLGTVAVHTRPSMAAGGDWNITLRGEAGHAAMPHQTRDPVTAAAHLIVELNSIVPRNVDPQATVALTCSMIHGGTVSNQIPAGVTLTGTLRTFDADLRAAIITRMKAVIDGTAAAMGVAADYQIRSTGRVMEDTPDERALAIAAAAAAGLPVTRDIRPVMGGRRFRLHGRSGSRGAYVFIGNGPVAPNGKLHEAGYDLDDRVLAPAMAWMLQVAKQALEG